MRTSVVAIALTVGIASLAFDVASADQADFEAFSRACSELGFKKRSESFGDCVVELDKRAKAKNLVGSTPNSDVSKGVGADGSEDDLTCRRFGFSVGGDGYGNCRKSLVSGREDSARQAREYEQRKEEYNRAVEAAEAERKRQKYLRAARCHFASAAAGSQPGATGTQGLINLFACEAGADGPISVPDAPQPPRSSTFQVNTANGTTTCSVVGNVVSCR